MRFYVEFIATEGDNYVIDVDERRIGFRDIEQAQQLYAQEIAIEKIYEFVGSWRTKTYSLELPERVARHLYQRRKLFEYTNVVQVTVPAESLNKYVVVGFDFEYRYEDEVVEVYPVHQVDDKQLLNDWIEASYPLVWGATKQTGGDNNE